jgi:hypothetical protein
MPLMSKLQNAMGAFGEYEGSMQFGGNDMNGHREDQYGGMRGMGEMDPDFQEQVFLQL